MSRKAVRSCSTNTESEIASNFAKFYNAVLFMGSVAVFSLIAQKLNAGK